jgi:competence ComEA-like helix-hairpin-helix protein
LLPLPFTISHYAPLSERIEYLQQSNCRRNENLAVYPPKCDSIPAENAVNINSAAFNELEKLPKIGAELAGQIVEHREKYGEFRCPEDLITVRGMTDKKFREIKYLVKTE